MDILTRDGIEQFTLEVEAKDDFDAESVAHLIATQGENKTVLTVLDVTRKGDTA